MKTSLSKQLKVIFTLKILFTMDNVLKTEIATEDVNLSVQISKSAEIQESSVTAEAKKSFENIGASTKVVSTGMVTTAEQAQLPTNTKRKHRRGKPKSKNGNKPYKKTNWKFRMPRANFLKYNNGYYYGGNSGGSGSVGGGGGGGGGGGNTNNRRAKLNRSRSLVPYNTNRFLMDEHLDEVPSDLRLTPTGRTRDSSFSIDSDDNYFYSLPEDEEEFLTKEFANVYEKARVEHLENLTKQQLIEEYLSIEDRYSKDQGTQQQQQFNIQKLTNEFMSKIKALEEKIRELSRENYNLRCQLMRSTAVATASPPSAAAPIGAACQPVPMESTSEDTESDSSSSSSSSSSSASPAEDCAISNNEHDGDSMDNERKRDNIARRRRSCSSRSSISEYNSYNENSHMTAGNLERDCINELDEQNVIIENALDEAAMDAVENYAENVTMDAQQITKTNDSTATAQDTLPAQQTTTGI